jgi:carbamoyl-phosphate synthase large subunit
MSSAQSGRILLPKNITILLTGVGAPGTRGTLYALRRNSDGINIRIVGVDMKEDAVGKYWSDKFYTVPAPESNDYFERINSICSKESVDLILPQTTRETTVFSRSKPSVKVAVSSISAIETANNKFELMKLCEQIGVPTPKFRLVRALADLIDRAEELGYPDKGVVVKPPVSWGSRGLRILRENTSWSIRRFLSEKPSSAEITLDDLSKILTRDAHVDFPELLVTEFLPGKEYTIDAFSGEHVSVAIPRLRKEVVNGISFRTSLEYREDVTNYSLKIAKALGLRYAFGFQFKLDYSDVPKILECNPRVQGTMVASVFSGVNVIWLAVREALGDQVEKVPDKLQTSEFYRYWGGLAVSDGRSSDISS